MPGRGFRRTDREAARFVFAERDFQRAGFRDVVQVGAGAVRVDVNAFARLPSGFAERFDDRSSGAVGVRARRGHVVGVARRTVTDDFAVNLGAAILSAFVFFQNENPGAFGDNETGAARVERQGRGVRVFGGRERFHRVETGDADFDDRRFRSAGQRDVGVTVTNRANRFADRVRAGRASGNRRERGAAEVVTNREETRRHVRDHHRNEERRNAARALVEEFEAVRFVRFETADSGAEVNRRAVRVERAENVAQLNRFRRRGDRELSAAIHLDDFGLFQPVKRVEVFHFAGETRLDARRVEARDRADSANAGFEVRPKIPNADSERRYGAHAGYNDSTVHSHPFNILIRRRRLGLFSFS